VKGGENETMKTINKILKSKKGFTLIELVVVIAVLGMIAVVAVPKIAGITKNAQTNSDAQMIAVLNEAVERYVAESGDDNLTGSKDLQKTIGNDAGAKDATKAIDALGTNIGTYGPYLDKTTLKTNGKTDDTKAYLLPSGTPIKYVEGKFSK